MKTPTPIAVIVMALLSLTLIACPTVSAQKTRTHTIKKDKHTANNRCIRFVGKGQIRVDFFVDPTWLYDENAPGYQSGWNKLIGISEGFNQHKNSVRIAWRSIENTIYISSYCYINGERKISEMVEVKPGWNSAEVSITDNAYRVQVNDWALSYQKSGKSIYKFMLYPYFGGNSTAPHEMEFKFRFKP